jgi:hypothetical protein
MMKLIEKFGKEQKGAVLVTSALTLLIVFGFAALSVDVGAMFTARNQMQGAIDAAALSGATGLTISQSEAQNRAVIVAAANDILNNPVNLSPTNITFPNPMQLSIQLTQPVNLYFANVFGISSINVSASATAELADISGTKRLRPFAVPEQLWQPGQLVVLKLGAVNGNNKGNGNAIPSSFHYAVCYPPENKGTPTKGGSRYRTRIKEGYEDIVELGDQLLAEPGNMNGPTNQGINYLIALDPAASWNGTQIVSSIFPGNSSPRVIKIPMFDINNPPSAGRGNVTVTNFGAFFVLPMQGQDLCGIFIETTTAGIAGSSGTFLKRVHLTS